MNNVIISLISLYLTWFCPQTEFISLKLVGKHDKSMPSVIISTQLIENKFLNLFVERHTYILKCDDYNRLKNLIQLNKTNNLPLETIEYGCFDVQFHDQDRLLFTYSTHRGESIRLFDQMIDILQHEINKEDLLSEFKTIRHRLD